MPDPLSPIPAGAPALYSRDNWTPAAKLRADLWPATEAMRALIRGLAREEMGRLALALTAVEFRLITKLRPARRSLRLAAIALARRKPVLGLIPAMMGGDAGGSRWWRPAATEEADAGWRAVHTIPVIDWSPLTSSPARCAEIVAIDQDDEARWWFLTGAVEVLGEAALGEALIDGSPLRLVRRPLDWARAGGDSSGAVCLLDPAGEAARRALFGAASLVCADPDPAARLAHGEALAKMQKKLRPKLPPIELIAGARDQGSGADQKEEARADA